MLYRFCRKTQRLPYRLGVGVSPDIVASHRQLYGSPVLQDHGNYLLKSEIGSGLVSIHRHRPAVLGRHDGLVIPVGSLDQTDPKGDVPTSGELEHAL